MKNKTMKILGILFVIIGALGIAGGIFLWFFNYWVMENGYYYFGDSIMVACTITLFFGYFLAPGIPFLIVSSIRQKRESRKASIQNDIPESVKYCGHCGARYVVGSSFCIGCGNKLN